MGVSDRERPHLRVVEALDPELADIVARAAHGRDALEASGGLMPEAQPSLEQELHALAQQAGCPRGPELSLGLACGGRGSAIVESVAREVETSGWVPGKVGVADAKPWLLLAGVAGSGKSVAAFWALTRATLLNGRIAPGGRRYVRSSAVAAKNLGFSPDKEWLDELAQVRWLVLDDLGWIDKGKDEHLAPSVQYLLDERHARRGRTVITTNLSRAALLPYVGDRVGSRLRQAATLLVAADGDMRRGTQGPGCRVR